MFIWFGVCRIVSLLIVFLLFRIMLGVKLGLMFLFLFVIFVVIRVFMVLLCFVIELLKVVVGVWVVCVKLGVRVEWLICECVRMIELMGWLFKIDRMVDR